MHPVRSRPASGLLGSPEVPITPSRILALSPVEYLYEDGGHPDAELCRDRHSIVVKKWTIDEILDHRMHLYVEPG